MIKEERAHCFKELGKMSIDEAQFECMCDFMENLQLFAGKEEDCGECSVANYSRFDNKYGKFVSYNNKNIQFETMMYFEKEFAKGYKNLNESVCMSKPEKMTISEIGFQRLQEDVGFPSKNENVVEELEPRYKVIFGRGEFPFFQFKIVRLGNKDYFWYTLER